MISSLKDINTILHQFFDKVLVLTVPRFTERQETVRQRLNGIDFEFFYGADKNELTDEYIRDHYLYDKKNSLAVLQHFQPLNKGEIACALSHRNIYESIIRNNWYRVLIFEDDVVPDMKNLDILADCLKELPSDWELFYLGYLKNENPSFGRKLKQYWYYLQAGLGFSWMPVSMISRLLPRNYSSSLMKAGFHDCTHAYAISRSGAGKLLKAQAPIIYRADNLLSAMVLKNDVRAFASRKFLFNQEIFKETGHLSHVRENQKSK